jgi:non-haem Fe2+, alpha-ketoglutarate-dependent halogenase
MPCKLTEAQIAHYRRDGFCFPVPVFSAAEVIDLRQQLETFETRQGHELQGTQRLKTNLLLPWVDRCIRDPRILDPVEDIIGPNILCWSVQFWIKEPKTIDYVSWHQDHQYWGLDSTEIVTAWVALSPATVESGCMRMQPGSHTARMPHRDLFEKTNMLSRGQTITEGIDEARAVPIMLKPGEMSLHHVRIAHASTPNRSADRRIGISIRYMPPHTRQQLAAWDSAALVRGEDQYGHFVHEPRPGRDFDPPCVAFHEKTVANLLSFLYKDATGGKPAEEQGGLGRHCVPTVTE